MLSVFICEKRGSDPFREDREDPGEARRDRVDQVALDMRLYTRKTVKLISEDLTELLNVILKIARENTDTYMPGFTHLQKAQHKSYRFLRLSISSHPIQELLGNRP